jgi:hypothetical protein
MRLHAHARAAWAGSRCCSAGRNRRSRGSPPIPFARRGLPARPWEIGCGASRRPAAAAPSLDARVQRPRECAHACGRATPACCPRCSFCWRQRARAPPQRGRAPAQRLAACPTSSTRAGAAATSPRVLPPLRWVARLLRSRGRAQRGRRSRSGRPALPGNIPPPCIAPRPPGVVGAPPPALAARAVDRRRQPCPGAVGPAATAAWGAGARPASCCGPAVECALSSALHPPATLLTPAVRPPLGLVPANLRRPAAPRDARRRGGPGGCGISRHSSGAPARHGATPSAPTRPPNRPQPARRCPHLDSLPAPGALRLHARVRGRLR